MSVEPIELMGGESVYCINEAQLKKAFDIVNKDDLSNKKISILLEKIKKDYSRNQRAALAFILIDSLMNENN